MVFSEILPIVFKTSEIVGSERNKYEPQGEVKVLVVRPLNNAFYVYFLNINSGF